MVKKKEAIASPFVLEEEQPYPIPENWCWIHLLDSFENHTDSKKKVQSKTYLKNGKLAVVDQGQELVGGYTDDENMAYSGKLPVIIFGDHTRCIKYIDFCFAQGADGVKVLSPKPFYDVQAFYFALRSIKIPNMGYRRHYPLFPQFCIPVPPLPEQHRIVSCIEGLFAKLDEAKEKVQTVLDGVELRKSAILHKAFTGELTKRWRKEHGVGIESWTPKTSKELFEYVTSGSRGWAQYYSETGAIFVRMGNLGHGTIELDFTDMQHVCLPNKAEGQRSRLQRNDILISITADVGMIGLVREMPFEAYINQHIALARPNRENSPEFLAWYLVSDVGLRQMQSKQRGATKVGLGLDDIRSLRLTMPKLAEQKEIIVILRKLIDKEQQTKEVAKNVLTQIDIMKKAILARAFRGELGTNDPKEKWAGELVKAYLPAQTG